MSIDERSYDVQRLHLDLFDDGWDLIARNVPGGVSALGKTKWSNLERYRPLAKQVKIAGKF